MEETEDPIRAEKARLRAQLRAQRAALDDREVAAASRAIASRILALPEVDMAAAVHMFWPYDGRHEVDTRPIAAALIARDVRVALPVVVSVPGEPPRLIQRLYVPGTLMPGRFGNLEPHGTADVPISAIEAVIVPALAASRQGSRLGYGGGFYDAFLATIDAPVICPVMSAFLLDALPTEPHDCAVDIVVTENEVVRVG